MILPSGVMTLVRSMRRITSLGPDRIIPSNEIATTLADGVVQLKTGPHPSTLHPPISVWTMLQNTVDRAPNRTALAVKRDGKKTFTVMQVDSKLVDRPIELGWRDDKVIEVVFGLADGDQVGIPNKPITKKRKGRRPR